MVGTGGPPQEVRPQGAREDLTWRREAFLRLPYFDQGDVEDSGDEGGHEVLLGGFAREPCKA